MKILWLLEEGKWREDQPNNQGAATKKALCYVFTKRACERGRTERRAFPEKSQQGDLLSTEMVSSDLDGQISQMPSLYWWHWTPKFQITSSGDFMWVLKGKKTDPWRPSPALTSQWPECQIGVLTPLSGLAPPERAEPLSKTLPLRLILERQSQKKNTIVGNIAKHQEVHQNPSGHIPSARCPA